MREYKFDPSVPRRMYLSDAIPLRNRCPECGAKLEQEYHTYEVAARSGDEEEFSLTGNDLGWFCPKCAVVVLDSEGFAELLSVYNLRGGRASEFIVLGIVNMKAIPKEKWNLQLGTADNPVPLVNFANIFRPGTPPERTNE